MQPNHAATPRLRTQRRRVLIADDEERQRSALEILLHEEGCEVVTVEDGYELLDYLSLTRAAGGTIPDPDVIVSDVRMPGETGLSALQKARALGVRSAIVVVTGYPSEEVEERVEALGAACMFRKPVDADALIERIRTIQKLEK